MGKFVDLTGQKFGRLTVVGRSGDDSSGGARWDCVCDCGKVKNVSGAALKQGKVKSCGCLRNENLSGKRFGKLIVLCEAEKDKHGNTQWQCLCDCGQKTIALGTNLKRGLTTSCGCNRRLDLTGRVFDFLTVIKKDEVQPNRRHIQWICRCICGKEISIIAEDLTRGNRKSCGCKKRELLAEASTKHGHRFERLYHIWANMRYRCDNQNCTGFKDYGARGIKVCDEWHDNFEQFRAWSLEHGYAEDLTIDRIDNNRSYSPDNCRWVTIAQQNVNRRGLRLITYQGQTKCMAEWAREYKIKPYVVRERLNHGWSVEDALTIPVKETRRGQRT